MSHLYIHEHVRSNRLSLLIWNPNNFAVR